MTNPLLPPTHPSRSLHHTLEYYNQDDWYNENLGVKGSPAFWYPGEPHNGACTPCKMEGMIF